MPSPQPSDPGLTIKRVPGSGIVVRKVNLPEPDRWADWRVTYAVVTGETDMGFSQVVLPEVDGGYSFLLSWFALPLDALPLRRGDQLSVTARRLGGDFAGFSFMGWNKMPPSTEDNS